MSDLNQCNFIGRLGKDPETRYSQGGAAFTNLSIAVGEKWKNKENGNLEERTEWVKVVFSGRLAEVAGEYLRKGSRVFVSGKMQTRKWQDNQGEDRYTTEIRGFQLQMLDTRAESEHNQHQKAAPPAQQQQAPAPSGGEEFEDDIPF